MKQNKSAKRSLLFSVLSLLLCCTMLAGTTFAWFTDSVTSGNNKIVAGNLDVELYHSNQVVINEKVTATTALFQQTLWEPGVAVFENLKVANEGTLALKYQLMLNFANAVKTPEGKTLADVLKVGVVADGVDVTADREAVVAAVATWEPLETFALEATLGVTESDTYGIVIWWKPSDVDNDFNMNNENNTTVLTIDVGVVLLATQVEAEGDVFGTDYDADATLPTLVKTNADLIAALQDNEDVTLGADIVIADTGSRLTMNGGSFDGNGKTVTYNGGMLTTGTSTMSAPVLTTKGGSISNLIVNAPSGRAIYVTTLTEDLYVANCVLSGSYAFNLSSSTVTNNTLNFSNTVFKSWTSYGNVVKVANFEDCVFEDNLRPYADTVLANCEFNGTGTLDLSELVAGETITLTGCTRNGTALTLATIEAMQDAGVDLTKYTFTEDAGVITITRYDAVANNVADLSAALTTGGQQVALNSDVTIADTGSRLTMNGGSFDGNGKTVTYNGGMLTTGTSTMSAPVITTKGGSISNLTVVALEGRAIYVTTLTEDLYVANCVLDGAYAFNLSSSVVTNYTINFSNTVFKSWTSYDNVVEVANFEDCVFEDNLRPYADTVLTNCEFTSTGTLDLLKLASGETITLTGCTQDGAALTVDMIKATLDDADLANYTIVDNAGVITITRN